MPISIIPQAKTMRSKTPPMPSINMIRYAPGREEAERKALCHMNDMLASENKRLVKMLMWAVSVTFVVAFICGLVCRRVVG